MRWSSLYSNLRSLCWKNFKLAYYLQNYLRLYIPSNLCRKQLGNKLNHVADFDKNEIATRVAYYNRLDTKFRLESAECLADFKYRKYCKNYFFDLHKYTRYFSLKEKIKYEFGDITSIPNIPTIVKSRPIGEQNHNAVLMKLNKVRHFVFVNDNRTFESKKPMLLWRGNIYPHQKNRIELVQQLQGHPLCDVRHINFMEGFSYEQGDKKNLYEHLAYRYIMSMEGNDVATNLKWIMSSNSIAVSPRLRYETWFMEGTLIPDYHYIEVADDYSDLVDKLTYYNNNLAKAKAIIQHANAHVAQFIDKRKEEVISLLTLQKYFELQK